MRKAKDVSNSGGGINWSKLVLALIVALPAMVVLLPTTLMLFVLSLPTIVAFLVDRTRERYLVATVGLLNLCGLLPGLISLWQDGQSLETVFRLLTDMFYWLMAYGAAAVGWGIFVSLPPMVTSYYALVTQHRIQQLRKRQKQLIEEWGDDVTGRHQAEIEIEAQEVEAAAVVD